jgi:hypothetical protein
MNKSLVVLSVLLIIIIGVEIYLVGFPPLGEKRQHIQNPPVQQTQVTNPDKQEGINNIIKQLEQKNFSEFEFFRSMLTGMSSKNYQSLVLIKKYRAQLVKVDDVPGYLDRKSQLAYALKLDLINDSTKNPLIIYYQENDLTNIKAYKGKKGFEITQLKNLPKNSELIITEKYNAQTTSLTEANITIL